MENENIFCLNNLNKHIEMNTSNFSKNFRSSFVKSYNRLNESNSSDKSLKLLKADDFELSNCYNTFNSSYFLKSNKKLNNFTEKISLFDDDVEEFKIFNDYEKEFESENENKFYVEKNCNSIFKKKISEINFLNKENLFKKKIKKLNISKIIKLKDVMNGKLYVCKFCEEIFKNHCSLGGHISKKHKNMNLFSK